MSGMRISILKLTWRSIRTFWGRYIALGLIVALSVCFFAGLKITKDAMIHTCDSFLTGQHFYDFRLYSTLGFTDEDVKELAALPDVDVAEGSSTVDALVENGSDERALTLLRLPENVNVPSLMAGRLPVESGECLADADLFSTSDLGAALTLSNENGEDVFDALSDREYTIVGLAESPLYIGSDRGSTNIGSGTIAGFLYLPESCFLSEVYTEIDLTLNGCAEIFSDEYDTLIESAEDEITQAAKRQADERYDDLLARSGLAPEYAAQAGILPPEVYVLTRDENAGYVGFESHSSIISGVANIFPLFFILIAMLVCITTMTRMVDEERTQIGVLKALGFGGFAISRKYLLYAGSATLLGWIAGYFLGTWGLPKVFWFAFNVIYDFAPLAYLFSPSLAGITLGVSLVGILGSTVISCRKELASVPAALIRPRAAKEGKRILLERIGPLWRRLPFLDKITLRNMFRYKRRLIMMLVGISCCAGLVVTAFGVRESMIDIGSLQFEQVQTYQIEADLAPGAEDDVLTALDDMAAIKERLTCYAHRVEVSADKTMSGVTLLAFDGSDDLSGFWHFHRNGVPVAFPGYGEGLINAKIANKLFLAVGDSIAIQTTDMQTMRVKVSGIFDNYVENFVIVSSDTCEAAFDGQGSNAVLLSIEGDTEAAAREVTAIDGITGMTDLADTKEAVDNSLNCLNYIIWLIVLFSGALAFIVIFNLTNINLAERSREIATVEVLGFYLRETETYVLRENLVLSMIAAVIGLPLGTAFHRVVMHMIDIDTMTFDIHISAVSYALAFVCTALFAVIVNLAMRRRIGRMVAVFVGIDFVMSAAAKGRTWMSIVGSMVAAMLLYMMVPMITPLDSGIVNVIGCFVAGGLVCAGLGSVSNVILKKTSLV